MKQANLFDAFDDRFHTTPTKRTPRKVVSKAARSGTFTDNMKLPIHRWFRYSAGFSAGWAEQVIACHVKDSGFTVLDPFAGSGTAVLAAAKAGGRAIGFESHPFVARIAQAKLLWYQADGHDIQQAASALIAQARRIEEPLPAQLPDLLVKCYAPDALVKLLAMRSAWADSPPTNSVVRELLWLALTSILRACSHVGTAQWQYVLPNKTKARALEPYFALEAKVAEMAQDIAVARAGGYGGEAEIRVQDARVPADLPENSIDLVVTSPPYPNNYDYADATRLEMTFWGEVRSWGDLQDVVRRYIIRSCSQHSAAEKLSLDELLGTPALAPIAEDLTTACRTLEEVRLTKGGKKAYHTMVAAYFTDLAATFQALRPICKVHGRLCFVIGDSAPYGVHVPAEIWLGELARGAGFRGYTFEKLRDRNVKWKNRKHRVPLQEGLLWIEG